MDRDTAILKKISSDIEFIIDATKDVSLEDFESNELLASAICFKFIQISENVAKISEGYRYGNPEIPWGDIRGMRNRIVHDYGNVSLEVVYKTIKEDLPNILELIK